MILHLRSIRDVKDRFSGIGTQDHGLFLHISSSQLQYCPHFFPTALHLHLPVPFAWAHFFLGPQGQPAFSLNSSPGFRPIYFSGVWYQFRPPYSTGAWYQFFPPYSSRAWYVLPMQRRKSGICLIGSFRSYEVESRITLTSPKDALFLHISSLQWQSSPHFFPTALHSHLPSPVAWAHFFLGPQGQPSFSVLTVGSPFMMGRESGTDRSWGKWFFTKEADLIPGVLSSKTSDGFCLSSSQNDCEQT